MGEMSSGLRQEYFGFENKHWVSAPVPSAPCRTIADSLNA
jgi:hypothetical protein